MNKEQIRLWVEQNAKGLMSQIPLDAKEIDHIAYCMEHIDRWYHEGYPVGDFLSAVVKDNFSEACFQADDINRKALYLYALFMANKIPGDYRKKAKCVTS